VTADAPAKVLSGKYSSRRVLLLTAAFAAFAYPFSIIYDGEGVSANYSFVLLPIIYGIARDRFRRPRKEYVLMMVVFTAIFAVATVYQIDFQVHFVRRVVSYVLFMTMFGYMFIQMDVEMVVAFKRALIGVSVWFSLYALYVYVRSGGAELGAHAKDVVGTSRYGFIYVLAVWLVYQDIYDGRWRALRYPVLLVLLIGILLTFSRASVVAVLGSFGLFVTAAAVRWLRDPMRLSRWRLVLSIGLLAAVVFAAVRAMPGTVSFFGRNLFAFVLDDGAVSESLTNSDSSEGYRLYIFRQMLDFTIANPVTGSGFLGVWILSSDMSGSAHDQYFDVLFRTGPIGFCLYGVLLIRLLKFLYEQERALFWGTVGVLIYGLVHETFKESHGGFVLAFLFGMMAQGVSQHRSRRKIRRGAGPNSVSESA